VPARERCGAVIGWHETGGEQTDSQSDRVTPFAGTWAEYHCPDDGWVPLDASDPFRIHAGRDVAVLPTVVIRDRRDRTWAAMPEGEAECCHTLDVVGQRARVAE
jgi:transglutaminase-like putative cysteine protease